MTSGEDFQELARCVLTPSKILDGRLPLPSSLEESFRDFFGAAPMWSTAYLPDGGLSRFRVEPGAVRIEGLDRLKSFSGTELRLFALDRMLVALPTTTESIRDAFVEAEKLRAARAQSDRLHIIAQAVLAEEAARDHYRVWVPRADYPQVAALLAARRSAVDLLDELPPITTDHYANRAAELVDVVCLPTQPFKPIRLYEVETTTSIQSGLIRLMEVFSFRTDSEAYVVAPNWRRSKYEREIRKAAFIPIRSHVRFLSLESVGNG